MIKFQGVKKTFLKRDVLDIPSLSFRKDDRVALIGGNGAGKTTMIRSLLGLYTQEGSVEVFGLDPRKDRVEILKKVGFVPQFPPPLSMTVRELVEFAANIYSDTGSTVDRIYEAAMDLKLDLVLEEKKTFSKLSGGMKQKLLIALALAKNTELVIMDEPAANLDPAARLTLFERLKETPKEVAMLLSSHRVDDVRGLVNRVIELDCGRVVKDVRVEDGEDFDSLFLGPTIAGVRVEREMR